MKVHVVEDDKELRDAAVYFLKNAEIEVSTSISGEKAVEEVLATSPDALLLDIMMPTKSGYQVLEELREQGFNKPVVVMSNIDQQSLDNDRLTPLNVYKTFLKASTKFEEIVLSLKNAVEQQAE